MPKAWTSSEQHHAIISILGLTVQPYAKEYQPALSYDAAPVHLSSAVLSEVRSAGMWLLLIPARMAWLLQPSDTHVFLKDHLYLKRRFANSLLVADAEGSGVCRMVALVISAMRYVLQACCWGNAFAQTGIWADQGRVSSTVLRGLNSNDVPHVSDERPTAGIVKACWPRNRVFQESDVMALVPDAAEAEHTVSTAASASSTTLAILVAAPIAKPIPKHRLRSKTTVK
jgi:hypothetical protein